MKRAALLCLAMTLALAAPASAETFTVNNTGDTSVPGGCDTVPQCSLRDAVDAASGADGNTVVIPAGRYELNQPEVNGDLDADADMTIRGAGARSTVIDANSLSRVLTVTDSDHTVSISGVTITGGLSSPLDNPSSDSFGGDGGGLLAFGTLTLTDSTVTGNSASRGGGGIYSQPVEFFFLEPAEPLTLIRTTVSNNTVTEGGGLPVNALGGGVASFGELTAINTTVHGNSVSTDEGDVLAQGGGIFSTNGLTTLTNTTVTGNTTDAVVDAGNIGAGITLLDGPVDPFSGDMEARNTIVAGNLAGGEENNCELSETTVTVNNISGDDSCGFTDSGSKENTNPQLFALRNVGGPTDTRNFPLTSPALDSGAPAACPSTDQRGVPRPQRGTCDIGAVELAPPSATTTGTSGVTRTTASIFGRSVNPLVLAGTAVFDVGTTAAYGATVPSGGTTTIRQAGATSGVAPQSAEEESAGLNGLRANTTYHYRLRVTNADGAAQGADRTFRTPAALTRPRLIVAGVRTRGCVRRAFTLRVRARVARGTRLKAVRVTLDGRTIKRTTRSRFTVRVNAAALSSGRHTLRIKAVDRGNRARTVTRRFRRCARVPVADPRFTG